MRQNDNINSQEIVRFLKTKDYILLKEIGQGGTGNTKLIRDETIEDDFVCKKYSPYYPEHKPLYYNNFVDEIKILYKINHPNIVRIFNYYLYPEKTTGFIIMEYINGVSIDEYIFTNPNNVNEIFVQVVDGFKYLEEKCILHRDIRPSNLLVSNENTVKIIDFGFGKDIQSIEDYGKSITLNWTYSLPNEFKDGIYDFKTEIYFVGKLFEQIINKTNTHVIFKYSDIISEMINADYKYRIDSFFNISRKISANDSIYIEFNDKEKEIYMDFADSIISVCPQVQNSTEYIKDFNVIKKGLENLYQDSMLEDFIQNNKKLISCFIKPPYLSIRTKCIDVKVVLNFLQWINGLSETKKRIMLNNLWQRFDNIERKIEGEDLPF